MTAITRIFLPALLAVAALGAQASELAPGDLGARHLQAGPAVALQEIAPAGPMGGEITPGDSSARPSVAEPRTKAKANPRIERPVMPTVIGA